MKPSGHLVYATCSLLNEENEAVVTAFLADHEEYEVVSADGLWSRLAPDAPAIGGQFMRLEPARHGTDGFFAAVLRRRPDLDDGLIVDR